MSSNADDAITVAEGPIAEEEKPPPPPPARRFPPPCWTQEETLALIDAYRERWYALRRGYLRTADWDAVAAAVTTCCPDASPAKTSAQCRHKMEKLRQRYRAEKQRSLSTPTGRFFSSWFFYDNMDAMENGTTVAAIRSNNQQFSEKQQGFVSAASTDNGYALKTIIDQNLLKLKINPKNGVNSMENSPPNFMFNVSKNSEKSNFIDRVPNGYCSYMDMRSNKEEQPRDLEFASNFRMRNGISMKTKRTGRIIGDINGFDHQGGSKGGNFMMNSGFDCDEGSEYNGSSNASDGFPIRNMGGSGSRRSYSANVEQQPNVGYSKLGKKGSGVGAKRGRDPVEEMVLSIKLLGEGFIKMEKMKMEMAKEVEQMRMEMEMKRNEMILESQKQIVDAFVKVLGEVNKNKNVKTVSPES
ncbi:hypothetical protein K7X08_020076 [Anisodus acutangulus]|uniref:Myb-like domain-containing protein n=1 Tax=Anisodus acutangulus TaxID=402998 RepID=A0A9Q1RF18_9SOLA|nr:hypothetical protein K7X08_020076 [Anisodus acutangulus]